MDSNNNHPARVRVCGLWRNKTRDGTTYLAGPWGSLRVAIFSNAYKRDEKDPDYVLYLSPSENRGTRKPEATQGAAPREATRDDDNLAF
jgi:hypothetical protein